MGSDLTENAPSEAPLFSPEDIDSLFDTTFDGEKDNMVSEAGSEIQVEEAPTDTTLRNDTSESESGSEDLTEDGERVLELRDEVLIHVQPSRHPLGVYVKVVDHESIEALFLPYRLFSSNLLGSTLDLTSSEFIDEKFNENTLRKALVVRVIKSANEHGKDRYIVSGKHFDEKILHRRFMQIRELCSTGETLQGTVIIRNKGGLLVRVCGSTCFLPRSYLMRQEGDIMAVSDEDFESDYKNSKIKVCVKEVQSSRNRIIVSSILAQTMQRIENLRIGSLVHGTVSEIVAYGVFVQLDGLPKKGLLHKRNISQKLVYSPETVFTEGDEVYAIVVDIDSNRRRIALSTADLEEERGEMLYNKERVLQNAPIMAARLKKELERAREQSDPYSLDIPPSFEQEKW